MAAGGYLNDSEAAAAVSLMMSGEAAEIHTSSFLSLLALRGPSVAELTGAARAMRNSEEPKAEQQAAPKLKAFSTAHS